MVRWRIERGLLVARAGRASKGHLQIDVRRLPGAQGERLRGRTCLHVEVEVANFHPAIASGVSRRLYNATQSRIHVIVTHGFLRSLAASGPRAVARGAPRGRYPNRASPYSARSFARSWRALMRRTVPERVRITSDSVLAPPALG